MGKNEYYFSDVEERAKRNVELIKKGIADFIAAGPKEDDLNKVKEYMLKTYQQNQKENNYWVGMLQEYYWDNLDMNTGYEDTLRNITADDLKAFAKAFFGQNNQIEVSMSAPEQK